MCFFLDLFPFLLAIYPLRLVPMCFSLGTHCGPSPLHPPHPLLFLNRFPLLPTIPFFLHKHHRLFGLISSFVDIHRDLCLCASFLIFSFLLAIYPLRLVPMCFSLGTHCGGRRCALPPAPPHPLLFLNRFPLLPTIPFFCISIIVYLG